MIRDGHYVWLQFPDGKETLVGRFEIRNGAVIFASEADKWNIDRIPPGPISWYTENLIKLFMKNVGETIRLAEE